MGLGLRGPEIIIILVLVLLLFGARRLPEMARSIGQSVREFRKGVKDIQNDINADDEPVSAPKVEAPKVEVVQSETSDEPSVTKEPV